MKLIDLLIKIANGEEVPNKIKIGTHILKKYDYPKGNGTCVPSYKSIDEEYHINDFLYPQYLNDEIEIIEDTPKEDKKIEKIQLPIPSLSPQLIYLATKINEIIDKVNGEDNE
jgi:hypothetical protein